MTAQSAAERPHHFDELYPGRFLKGATLAGPQTIRIVSMGGEVLEGDKGKQLKGVLKYKGMDADKKVITGEFVVCKTNAILISKAIGEEDYTKWGGHLITIYFDRGVMFGSEKKGGIRIYGSPELKRDIKVEVKRPRRTNPEVYTLKGSKGNRPVAAPDPNLQAQIAAVRECTEIEQLDEVLGNIATGLVDGAEMPEQLLAAADAHRATLAPRSS